MTRKKDLKKLVRSRQAKTGESYTTALRNLKARKKPPVEKTRRAWGALDTYDVTPSAESLGYRCNVELTRLLWRGEGNPNQRDRNVHTLLRAFLELLETCPRAPQWVLFRRAVFDGKPAAPSEVAEWLTTQSAPNLQKLQAYGAESLEDSLAFIAQLRRGDFGPSPLGRLLAFTHEERVYVAAVSTFLPQGLKPQLKLQGADELLAREATLASYLALLRPH